MVYIICLRLLPKHPRKSLFAPKVRNQDSENGVHGVGEGRQRCVWNHVWGRIWERTWMRTFGGRGRARVGREKEVPPGARGWKDRRWAPRFGDGYFRWDCSESREDLRYRVKDFHATDVSALCLSFPPMSWSRALINPHSGKEHPGKRAWSQSTGDFDLTRVRWRPPKSWLHPQPWLPPQSGPWCPVFGHRISGAAWDHPEQVFSFSGNSIMGTSVQSKQKANPDCRGLNEEPTRTR